MKYKIAQLRDLIIKQGLYGYIIPTSDEFLNEYPPLSNRRLEFISGFNCSNGYLVVCVDRIVFITDSRYTHAAKEYFAENEIYDLKNIRTIFSALKTSGNFGYNPKLFSSTNLSIFEELVLQIIDSDLVDQIWANKPPPPATTPFIYQEEYSGESSASKIQKLREFIDSNNAKAMMIFAPESVCWLLNIRAYDSEFSPIMLSHMYVDLDRVVLFTAKRDLTCLSEMMIEVQNLEEVENFCTKLEHKILVPADSSIYLQSKIPHDLRILTQDPILLMRALKDSKEIMGAKNAHILDAISVIEFLTWLEDNVYGLDEYELGIKITELRAQHPSYLMDSFAPIVGFNANGSKTHYRASKQNCSKVQKEGLLLIDSGAHYLGGTTDITRTVAIGKPAQEHKINYTNVLKGHIALANIKFPEGIKGGHLDILARQYLWNNGKDYGHGTGHGVGNCLSVHEGPASISLYSLKYGLRENMIFSNEPGYYQNGDFGIRIENLQFVTNSQYPGFLEFEQLTLVPYCSHLIDFDLINKDELTYLSNYYRKIYDTTYNLLSNKAKKYLVKELGVFL
ncbi:MAG: aminopeptidase P family protein [Rickettsiaceae bacterium]|nr:aminopeptidase P family protein [Rickettsiaceae bacterium]